MKGELSQSHIPSTAAEFKTVDEMKTHKLESLLRLAGLEAELKSNTKRWTAWGKVLDWNPENRYAPIQGVKMGKQAQDILTASTKISHYFWRKI